MVWVFVLLGLGDAEMKWIESITKGRLDITNYLIHWTESFRWVFSSGVLLASNSIKDGKQTISNGPAVCFSEMPIGQYLQATKNDRKIPKRYPRWAIIIPKRDLYNYGGRPVLYGDITLKWALEDNYKYLFNRYVPSEVDWTHEREWRAKPNVERNRKLGIKGQGKHLYINSKIPNPGDKETCEIIVPILHSLNTDAPNFIFLVDKDSDKDKDSNHWQDTPVFSGIKFPDAMGPYYERYLVARKTAKVFSFEEIARREIVCIEDLLTD